MWPWKAGSCRKISGIPNSPTYRQELASLPRRAHFFEATQEGRVVGTTGLMLKQDYAYLIGTQVLEIHRGRGVYCALVATRTDFLVQHGISLAVIKAREATSAPILKHLGFESVFESKCFLLT